ncbi:MAG: cobalamin-dependent protein [Gammaproteobacteria bacterium]|nr:cobalamin-dependent protein [Gammaproteobacteria bacterium]
MPDILLSHGYFLAEDEKEQSIMRPYPPLGLLYLSAWLKQQGYDVELFDSTLRTRQGLLDRLASGSGVLGLYTNLITRKTVVELATAARQHGWTVVLGGPEPANYPAEYLAHGADVVVIGEGEQTLAELLPRLANDGPHQLHGLPGTIFRDEAGALVRNSAAGAATGSRRPPWPDRAATDIHGYLDLWRTHHGQGAVNLITARVAPTSATGAVTPSSGTPSPALARRCRRRSPADPGRLRSRVGVVQRRRLHDPPPLAVRIPPPPQAAGAEAAVRDHLAGRPDDEGGGHRDTGRDGLLPHLDRVGERSQRILDRMERGVTVEQVQWATKMCQRYGIQVGMFLMWGYDGEELEDIAATVDHVAVTQPDVFFTTVAYPIRNTGYDRLVADRVQLAGDWLDSTDRDREVLGRPGRDYYREADQWLRNAVAAAKFAATDPASRRRIRRRPTRRGRRW